jgi:hypothetical protein
MKSQPPNPHSMMKHLIDHVDQAIQLEGQCSKIMWQHLMGFFLEYPHQAYFDLDDGSQTVIYSKQKITSECRLQLTGKVIALRGGSKRPKSSKNGDNRETKVDETYVEYHLLVDQWNEKK